MQHGDVVVRSWAARELADVLADKVSLYDGLPSAKIVFLVSAGLRSSYPVAMTVKTTSHAIRLRPNVRAKILCHPKVGVALFVCPTFGVPVFGR